MEPIKLVVWEELEGGVKAVVFVFSAGFSEMLSSRVGAEEVAVNDAASPGVCICDDDSERILEENVERVDVKFAAVAVLDGRGEGLFGSGDPG